MVTANLSGVSSAFESIAEDRDLKSMAALAVAGAGGGILATELSDRVLPVVGLTARPTDGQSYLANGAFKALVAFGLGYAAIQTGGTLGATLGLAGLGALVVGGADIVSALQSLTLQGQQMVTGSNPMSSGNGSARVTSVSTRSSQGSHDNDDGVQFRASDTGKGGEPERRASPGSFR